jgi:hypothetical protein
MRTSRIRSLASSLNKPSSRNTAAATSIIEVEAMSSR